MLLRESLRKSSRNFVFMKQSNAKKSSSSSYHTVSPKCKTQRGAVFMKSSISILDTRQSIYMMKENSVDQYLNRVSMMTKRFYSNSDSNSGVNSLVLIEHNEKKISSASLSALGAAQTLGGSITALLLTCPNTSREVIEQAKRLKVVSKVLHCEHEKFEYGMAEYLEPTVSKIIQDLKFTHLFAAHTVFGKNLIPRVGASLDVQPIADIIAIENEKQFSRLIYAGNAVAHVESTDPIKLITVRSTAFDKVEVNESPSDTVPLQSMEVDDIPNDGPQWVSQDMNQTERPELSSANIVISGGRGLKSGDNFKLVYDLADQIGAAVGASRAAVDAGFCPNDMQVGQTGTVVAPQLYMAVGISGAIQHLAGMKDSKCIVAINKDAEAPIFQVADYGLVQDLFKAVPEMTEKLKKQ